VSQWNVRHTSVSFHMPHHLTLNLFLSDEGTWSDGKLTTRIGRNSGPVRFVLETLVKYGAPARILVEGSPHLGTDNLVRLLRNMREDLRALGGEIHFGCRASQFHIENGRVTSVSTESVEEDTSAPTSIQQPDAVVLATGHSARDVYEELHKSGVPLEAKGFAVGFRIEHPQRIINEIQYGQDWGGRAVRSCSVCCVYIRLQFSIKLTGISVR
jgi:uncharacterized FAD-dependent dehydrogenase